MTPFNSIIPGRARAPGRPKPGSIPSGDRSAYPMTEGQS